jgi:hypothetical protein
VTIKDDQMAGVADELALVSKPTVIRVLEEFRQRRFVEGG